METITINGEEYVKRADVSAIDLTNTGHVCVICTNGWIFEGREQESDAGTCLLRSASVVRRWTNGRGIGGIAKAEYKDEYTLDPVGTIRIREAAIIGRIALEW